jgi:hypothetical protein
MPIIIKKFNARSSKIASIAGEPGEAEQVLFVLSSFLRQALSPLRLLIAVACFLLFFLYSPASGAEITGPGIKFQENEIYVTTALSLDEKSLQELRNGMPKEYRFYVDLFRVWKIWPDEFVLNKSFVRTLKSDPVKNEYLATSSDGNTFIQKRFKSLESMIQWALNINDLTFANTKELEPAVYFVRTTVESKIRKLPPVVGYFMIFLPENEFKLSKDSPPFSVGKIR